MPENIPAYRLPVYHDKWIRFLGIPIITFFGYYLTYEDTRFNGWFVYEVISDAVKVFLVWQAVRYSIVQLDKRFPWQQHFVKRLLIQVILVSLVGIATLTAMVYLEYGFIRPYQMQHYWSLDVIIAFIFLQFVNGMYVGLYFYDSYLQSLADKNALAQKLQQLPTNNPEHLVVKVGKKDILVPYSEISCIYSEAKETYLLTSGSKTYLFDASLDNLEEQLPEALFFRANRKFILTSNLVQSFVTEAHGKLTVYLKPLPKLPETITISRDKAPLFRRWLKR